MSSLPVTDCLYVYICLILIVLLFIGCILGFKAYLIECVWNCYRYVSGQGTSEILLYVTTNDTTVSPLDCAIRPRHHNDFRV
uniref:Lysosomal-associated transmembrane protein 4B n=1 Tax=Monopterus albus TaxID=43700 RepID=A0A3Q3JCS7_MONAL